MQIPPSERLVYTLVGPDDAEFLFDVDQDEAVMRFINGGQKTSRQTIMDVFIPRVESFTNPELGWGLWRVTTRDEQLDLGWILVRPMNFFVGEWQASNLELGWRFKQSTWGKGFATEAAQAVLDALRDNGVAHFSAIALADNKASINIMLKLGMVYCGEQDYSDAVFSERVVVYSTDQNVLNSNP